MTQAPDPSMADAVQIDIVSDVMCPWCIIGYRQLEHALATEGIGAFVRWHPFELNPDMPAEGQNLGEHIAQKYGVWPEQSAANRKRLVDLGQTLGFTFNFDDESRIVNTFAAHQLLDWAQQLGRQHPLMMALFEAHFTAGRDVSDPKVLIAVAEGVDLDPQAAREVLESGAQAESTRAREHVWTSRGISGVPSMIFGGKYLLTGAQGAETYGQVLRKVLAEKQAA